LKIDDWQKERSPTANAGAPPRAREPDTANGCTRAVICFPGGAGSAVGASFSIRETGVGRNSIFSDGVHL
jgi:hypothetical protein